MGRARDNAFDYDKITDGTYVSNYVGQLDERVDKLESARTWLAAGLGVTSVIAIAGIAYLVYKIDSQNQPFLV